MFIVATPIGNLEDITLRAIRILRDVDLIASENVGKTRNLLRHYGIKTPVTSYRESNAKRAIPGLIRSLESGSSIALVTEAGTPGLSDPGRRLVREAMARGHRVTPVPGASAAIAAVSVSGMEKPQFVFEGFLPRRGSKRRKRLEELSRSGFQLVFFEAPHRLVDCLKDIRDVLGDRECLVAREITKLHEEIKRDSVTHFIEKFEKNPPRGEFVIVYEGRPSTGGPAGTEQASGTGRDREEVSGEQLVKEANRLAAGGRRKREIAKILAKRHGLKAGEVYETIVKSPAGKRKEKSSGD